MAAPAAAVARIVMKGEEEEEEKVEAKEYSSRAGTGRGGKKMNREREKMRWSRRVPVHSTAARCLIFSSCCFLLLLLLLLL